MFCISSLDFHYCYWSSSLLGTWLNLPSLRLDLNSDDINLQTIAMVRMTKSSPSEDLDLLHAFFRFQQLSGDGKIDHSSHQSSNMGVSPLYHFRLKPD